MDLITGLPKSRGFDSVLTIVDHGCSRGAIFLPCHATITSPQIAQLYYQHVYPWYGLPSRIISDRDPGFTSHFGRALAKELGIEWNLSTAYHPQTDGLSERANQWLEQFLRLTTANQEDWSTALSIATLVHNNSENSTIKASPNQLLIGREPPATLSQGEGTDNPTAEQRVHQLRESRILITQALNRVANQWRPTEAKWEKGQKVWLEAKNLSLPYGSIKLAPRRHGPFLIERVISLVVYQLCLPPQWTIHPVFHTSLLTPCVETKEHGENFSRPPPDLINDEEQYEVEAIRSHRRQGRRKQLQYLIKWKGYLESDNTWEPADHVQAPQLIRQYEQRQGNNIKATQIQPLHYPPNWGNTDILASALSQKGLLPFTSTSHRSYEALPTPRTPSPSSCPDAPTGPSHTRSPPLEHATSPTSTRWKPRTSVRTPTASHTTEICPTRPSICQTSPQPQREHHPPTAMNHHLHSKHPHLPKRDRCPCPSCSAWRSARPPHNIPLSPLEPPPAYSIMRGPPTDPPTSPYLPKPPRTSSSNKMMSMRLSKPQPMALSPPSTAERNNTPSTCAKVRDVSWQNGSALPNATNTSPPSNADWATSRYPQDSSLTMGASTAQFPPKRDSRSSHNTSAGWAMERWRCWQEGKQRNWSTLHSSTSCPITHPPWPNPCPPGSFSFFVDHLWGSTSLPWPHTPWTNGRYMLRYSATEKTMRSAGLLRPKSQSSPADSQSCKSDWTTAGLASKWQKSLACSKTSKDAPTSPVASEDLHIEADASISMAQECHFEERVMSPPRYTGELPQLGDCCDCVPKWRCNPHDACFIHDSCFCEGSGSWPPVKPVCSYWRRYSLDWQTDMEPRSCPLPFP
jgi:hypothetical protein